MANNSGYDYRYPNEPQGRHPLTNPSIPPNQRTPVYNQPAVHNTQPMFYPQSSYMPQPYNPQQYNPPAQYNPPSQYNPTSQYNPPLQYNPPAQYNPLPYNPLPHNAPPPYNLPVNPTNQLAPHNPPPRSAAPLTPPDLHFKAERRLTAFKETALKYIAGEAEVRPTLSDLQFRMIDAFDDLRSELKSVMAEMDESEQEDRLINDRRESSAAMPQPRARPMGVRTDPNLEFVQRQRVAASQPKIDMNLGSLDQDQLLSALLDRCTLKGKGLNDSKNAPANPKPVLTKSATNPPLKSIPLAASSQPPTPTYRSLQRPLDLRGCPPFRYEAAKSSKKQRTAPIVRPRCTTLSNSDIELPFKLWEPKHDLSQFDFGKMPDGRASDGQLWPSHFGLPDPFNPGMCYEHAWTMKQCRKQNTPQGCPLNHAKPSKFWCWLLVTFGLCHPDIINWILQCMEAKSNPTRGAVVDRSVYEPLRKHPSSDALVYRRMAPLPAASSSNSPPTAGSSAYPKTVTTSEAKPAAKSNSTLPRISHSAIFVPGIGEVDKIDTFALRKATPLPTIESVDLELRDMLAAMDNEE
ncbi:hypothetical protein ACN47E_000156 [Coniothyrium glycines]